MRRLAAAFALAATAALALGLAAESSDAAGKITIQVTQVLATSDGKPGPKEFDPALAELQAEIEKLAQNYSYRVYKRAGVESKEVAEGEVASFKLSGEAGFTLRVTPTPIGKLIALDPLQIKDKDGKDILTAAIKVKDGGTGWVNKELESKNGRLFLAFTVKKG